jgi:hypothetical protein
MPDRAVTFGAHLNPDEEKALVQFLNKNKDVFSWSAKDLQGVDRDIIEHALEADERIPPKKQKLRKMSEEKVKAVEAEVQRLQQLERSKRSETFANLRAANLKLNPEKCVFGIHKGKVLGCLVSRKG